MTIETKELVISEELKRKIEMIGRFAYVEYEFINGNIKSIKNTNIAYVKPHIENNHILLRWLIRATLTVPQVEKFLLRLLKKA